MNAESPPIRIEVNPNSPRTYHTGEVWPTHAYQDGPEVIFFDAAERELPWHKSFPEEIGDVALFCRSREISLH